MRVISVSRRASLRAAKITCLIIFLSNLLFIEGAKAAECDFAGLPRISSTGVNQENCDFDTASSTKNFIEYQKNQLSGARTNREYVDTRLLKLNSIRANLPKNGELKSSGGVQEKINAWENQRVAFETRVQILRDAVELLLKDSQKNALNRTSSLYDWLLYDNRDDLSVEARTSPDRKGKAEIVDYEVQVADSQSGTPLYLRTTVKSVTPYTVFVDFTSYTSVSEVLQIKQSFQKLVDRREQISLNFATQWAQGPQNQWKVGDPVYLSDEGSIALIEKRWFSNGALYETWLTRINYPKEILGSAQFRLSDWGSPECLRVLLANDYGGGVGCQIVKTLGLAQAKETSKKTLEGDFVSLYQKYQDSQALALILGKEYLKYPEYMLAEAESLITLGIVLENQVFSLKSEIKAQADLERQAEIDSAVSAALDKAKKKTILCIKGKFTKKVTANNPKCPKGYKKK